MRYMTVYVEVASQATDDELRTTLTHALVDSPLRARDGHTVGHIIHAQVTEGPKPTRQPGSAS